ncbi:MAG: aldolase [bacterium]|nr:MAG: aldolase [bacterium]
MITEREAKKKIVEIGQRLYEKGLISATDGNLSIRIGDRIIATPSGVSKGFLKENDLVVVDRSGNKLSGSGKPSTELDMHLEVYKVRPDVEAVVHAHPPKCLSFIIAGENLSQCVIPEVVVSIGAIPTAQYATPSTEDMARSIHEPIQRTDAIMLDRHGSLTVGHNIEAAYNKLEKMEHAAEVMLYAKLLGNVRTLDRAEVDKLMSLRDSTYGLRGKVIRCDDDSFPQGSCSTSVGASNGPNDKSMDELVKIITQKVLERIKA